MDKPKAIIAIGVKPEEDDAEDSQPSSEGVEVPTPKGWEWPNGVDPKEGDRFMCTIKQGDDGKLIIADIDGLPMGSESDEGSEDQPDDAPKSAMEMFSKGKASLMGS